VGYALARGAAGAGSVGLAFPGRPQEPHPGSTKSERTGLQSLQFYQITAAVPEGSSASLAAIGAQLRMIGAGVAEQTPDWR
jgi:hypothetical protein